MTPAEFVDKWGDMEEWREGRNDHAMLTDLTALLAEREQQVRNGCGDLVDMYGTSLNRIGGDKPEYGADICKEIAAAIRAAKQA